MVNFSHNVSCSFVTSVMLIIQTWWDFHFFYFWYNGNLIASVVSKPRGHLGNYNVIGIKFEKKDFDASAYSLCDESKIFPNYQVKNFHLVNGSYTYDVNFEEGRGKAKMRCYRTKGVGVAIVLDVQSLFFY